MRDGIEDRVGDNVAERVQFGTLKSTIAAAITARTATPPAALAAATGTTSATDSLTRLNTKLAPELSNPSYTTGDAAIHLPVEMYPGPDAARHGRVYFDPTMPAPSTTGQIEAGVTNAGVWSGASGPPVHFFAGYIRLGPAVVSGSDAEARLSLFHEWSHYSMQVARNGTLTDPDLIAIRDEMIRGDASHADCDEHMIIISQEIERFGDTITDSGLNSSVSYLGIKMAGANSRFQTVAIDRLVRWAMSGKPSRKPPRTPRQRRLLAAIAAAGRSSLAPLRARVDVNPP
jgi:hypothetical protein